MSPLNEAYRLHDDLGVSDDEVVKILGMLSRVLTADELRGVGVDGKLCDKLEGKRSGPGLWRRAVFDVKRTGTGRASLPTVQEGACSTMKDDLIDEVLEFLTRPENIQQVNLQVMNLSPPKQS